jgi:TolA-binding protein
VTVFLLVSSIASARPASAEITFKLPPPEVSGLLPLAALPLDKPPVVLSPAGVPPIPQGLPELPPARFAGDPARRPVAPLASPRMLACNPVGTVFGVASELVECGRARYQRGELEPARQALQTAAQETSDRELQREARYWLGETLLRLGRPADVERVLAPVAQDDPRGDFGLFATHTLGWVALDANDPARALPRFESLLKGRMPVVLIPTARHGRALALHGLKRYPEARDEWVALLASNPPRPLADEVTFWLGDTLGRLGDEKGAVARLKAFPAGGPPPLAENALLSLGWWSRAAGQPAEAVKAYRAFLSAHPQSPSAAWARAGLVQALLDQNDFAAAREEARRLEALSRTSPLVLPSLLSLRRWAADKGKAEEGQALDTDLLARTLDPETRAWVLLLSGELARQAGNPGEARDRLELVRSSSTALPAVKQQAELRLAQIDFDAREYGQAQMAAQALLGQSLADDVRAAALILAAESAYWARNWDQAAASYSRFLSDFPKRPEAPAVGFALGWAEFRRGRLDAARDRWAAFAREAPADPRAGEALLLAAELAAKAGDRAQARAMFDRVAGQYPGTEQAEVARLNRAILSLNAGRATDALAELNRVGPGGSASSPYLGRARVAKGLALVASKQPAAAESELKAALGQGDDAIAHLGLGVIAFGRGQWEAAARAFGEARDAGAGGVAAAAEYGLAAVAFNQGKTEDFKKLAEELQTAPDDPATTPFLLRGMEAVAVQDKRWADARTLAVRLADQYPRSDVTPAALADVGAGAGAAEQWPLAREMYQTLAARYPSSPGRQAGRVVLAEALLRTGAPADARRELEGFIATASLADPRRPRAIALLGEAQEATGDRAAAAQTYARFATENPTGKEAPAALLGAGRLLQGEAGKWDEARPLLERAVKDGVTVVAAEAAYHLGEGLRAAGRNDDAAEAYMTAAYVAPDSVWARRALLGAGRAFAAAKQNDAAVIVYKKLLAASSVEPDLASEARTRLKSLGVN